MIKKLRDNIEFIKSTFYKNNRYSEGTVGTIRNYLIVSEVITTTSNHTLAIAPNYVNRVQKSV